ncbi:MAG: hypothetical protein NC311_11965 [Muribaculaceae bacterium]|nr:hypothetical protein [Muribaculaceae bacterium]
MKNDYFMRVQACTPTRFWINNVTREQARLAIDHGAVGCTQNPAYAWKMISSEEERPYVAGLVQKIIAEEKDDNAALVRLQRELVGGVAAVFKPIYDASNGKNGYVSIQGDPFLEDTASILEFAKFNRKAGENIMCKIPVIPSGLAAIEQLIRDRVPINATECMAVRQVLDVCDIYEKTTKNMVNPAPLYFSVITGIFDQYIKQTVESQNIDIPADYVYQGGIAIAKKVYEIVKQRGYDCHFIGGGARGLHHFTEMVGADCAVTINWVGTADKLLEQDQPAMSRFFNPIDAIVIDTLCDKIPDFRKAYEIQRITPEEYEDYGPVVLFRSSFEDAWRNARAYIAGQR